MEGIVLIKVYITTIVPPGHVRAGAFRDNKLDDDRLPWWLREDESVKPTVHGHCSAIERLGVDDSWDR